VGRARELLVALQRGASTKPAQDSCCGALQPSIAFAQGIQTLPGDEAAHDSGNANVVHLACLTEVDHGGHFEIVQANTIRDRRGWTTQGAVAWRWRVGAIGNPRRVNRPPARLLQELRSLLTLHGTEVLAELRESGDSQRGDLSGLSGVCRVLNPTPRSALERALGHLSGLSGQRVILEDRGEPGGQKCRVVSGGQSDTWIGSAKGSPGICRVSGTSKGWRIGERCSE